jgi:hypothetical protein
MSQQRCNALSILPTVHIPLCDVCYGQKEILIVCKSHPGTVQCCSQECFDVHRNGVEYKASLEKIIETQKFFDTLLK